MRGQVDQIAAPLTLDSHFARGRWRAGLLHLKQRGADLQSQVRMGQRQQVARQLARHITQEAPSTFGDVQDIGMGVDDDARRRGLFQGAQVDIGVGRLAHGLGDHGAAGDGGAHVATPRHGRCPPGIGQAAPGAEDAVAFVHGGEQVQASVSGLGGPQEQVAARAQGEMEHLHDVALYVAVEVNQQVPADDQVDLRKRRVQQQAVLGEQHFLADFLAHAKVLLFAAEVLAHV
ncbi:hypothetical protein D3C76_1006650 [compost metagenome]